MHYYITNILYIPTYLIISDCYVYYNRVSIFVRLITTSIHNNNIKIFPDFNKRVKI